MLTDLQVTAPEYTSPDILQVKSPDASKQFGACAVDPNMNPQLQQVLNPQEPIIVQQKGSIQCERTFNDQMNSVDETLNQGGCGILADCVGAATKLADDVGQSCASVGTSKPEMAVPQPDVPDMTIAAQAVEQEVTLDPTPEPPKWTPPSPFEKGGFV